MGAQAPGIGRVLVMVLFTLSVFALLIFLWLSFGGPIPLKPKEYRVEIAFPQAATLADEADVRISGINVGTVKELELQKSPPRTVATLAIDERYAPISRDTRATLRQKTLLGETYVELTPATRSGATVDDGGRLPADGVLESVELDEIFQAFDQPTRRAFKAWVEANAGVIDGRGRDLNAALASFPGFAEAGTDVLAVLHAREDALARFVRNTGIVFAAVNERRGALRDLIVNSSRLFDTTAARDEAIADIIEVFPTFLDESRATLRRLQEFAVDTRPLVNDLIPVARDLGPTLRDLRDIAPDLTNLFRDVDALADVAPRTFPDAARLLRGAGPVLEGARSFFTELNPMLSFAYFQAPVLADFLTVGGAALAGTLPPADGTGPRHYLRQIGVINNRSLALNSTRPPFERANAYLAPNAHLRARATGILESFDCEPAGGRKPDPDEGLPPCFVEPASLWEPGQKFPFIDRGQAPVVPPPQGNEGVTRPRAGSSAP